MSTAVGSLKAFLYSLYRGNTRRARYFLIGSLLFDLLVVTYFIATTFFERTDFLISLDFVLGGILLLDYAINLWLSKDRWFYLFNPLNLINLLVTVTLLLPTVIYNFAFLRIIRSLRIVYLYRVLRGASSKSGYLKRRSEIAWAVLNLGVFLFVITSLVYVTQTPHNATVTNFLDALYYTVTTLTTTGYGDITLVGPEGRLLSILLMLVGLSLFLRLLQALFHPDKVVYTCPKCGLQRHDADAVHCKYCGVIIKIPHEG